MNPDTDLIGTLLTDGALLALAVWTLLFLVIFIDQLRRGR